MRLFLWRISAPRFDHLPFADPHFPSKIRQPVRNKQKARNKEKP
nr:MAG TPA: hypothetical protein [Caudoviricetes sp.]